MAYTTVNDSSAHFQIALYTGNGGTQSITNDGNSNLKPDFMWIKDRSASNDHKLQDSTRGSTYTIESNTNTAQYNDTTAITSFNTDGFTTGNNGNTNTNSNNYVGWQWKANGGTTASNSSGNITSTVQANTTAGFSIVKYTGNGSSNQTVGHSLGVTPDCLIWKNYDTDTSGWNWKIWHKALTGTNIIVLNSANGEASSNGDVDALPTSTLFTVGTNGSTNGNTYDIICYAFNSIQGYSKFGKYTGNGNADGTFVYTGFKPAFVIQKQINVNGEWWMMKDFKREPFNQVDKNLYPNQSNNEVDTNGIDLLSNGFKCRTSGAGSNGDGAIYMYMAFAENPLVATNNVIALAK